MSEVRNTSQQASPGRRLRDAMAAGPVLLPGVFNPLVAKLAEQSGFQAVYLSGAALSASLGVPDIGLVTLSEFVDAARAITAATSLPLVCDADTGFGEALSVERAVRMFESAGVAGIHVEDQILPKRCGHLSGKNLVETSVMVAKIRAGVSAKRDPDFLLIARTDARGVSGFDDAVKRAHAYRAAGADAIFPEALRSLDEFAAFAKAVPGPLLANMTEFGKSPLHEAKQLEAIGYRLILFPVSSLRIAMKAVEELFSELQKSGTQKHLVNRMYTRAQLYELLGYSGYEERDRAHFGG